MGVSLLSVPPQGAELRVPCSIETPMPSPGTLRVALPSMDALILLTGTACVMWTVVELTLAASRRAHTPRPSFDAVDPARAESIDVVPDRRHGARRGVAWRGKSATSHLG